MADFLRFFEDKVKVFPMHFTLTYSKTCDWELEIMKHNCAEYYPEADLDGDDVIIFRGQDLDLELLCAKAHAALKEWLIEYESGY
ncbi:hypothetical protein IKE71_04220 [Candidatus Saccharibacteria bacterium]|nr:hypothetical protein [Candidatus Saccharibacteria bacterium]